MRNQISLFLLSLGILLLMSSCGRRVFDFTLISTKNVDLSKAAQFEHDQKRVTGKDKIFYVLTFPAGVPSVKEAIDRAIEQTPGAIALKDGVVSSKFYWYILSGRFQYIVEGTPLIDPSLVYDAPTFDSKYNYVTFDKKGEVKEMRPLTEEDYLREKKKVQAKKRT